MTINKIVIVGAGQAAANAILQLRGNDYLGQIVLIGDEPHLPYERPPLSKEMILQPEQTRVEILSQAKMDELQVELMLGKTVTQLLPEAHQLLLSDGSCISYDKLLLAMGATPRRLSHIDAVGQSIYSLRTLEDAQILAQVLQPDRHLVLIGGGVIGLELASSARLKQCQVTIIEANDRLMARTAPAILSDFLLQQQRRAGVEVMLSSQIVQAAVQQNQIALQLSNGQQLHADVVVYGIGVLPNLQLAQDAGLAVDGGIQVDHYCRSSAADIYAAGDVATQRGDDGRYRRLETWDNANQQASIFARHVLGLVVEPAAPAWFWSDQLHINYQFAGDMQAQTWYVRGELDAAKAAANRCVLLGVEQGQIVAGICINAGKDMRPLKKLIAQQARFDAALHLNPQYELRQLASEHLAS
jgi:3-phenylpropionate/trans-cinnamate dioxygenase ferredoxin reductase subunit